MAGYETAQDTCTEYAASEIPSSWPILTEHFQQPLKEKKKWN
jgi:hypothetical protein